MCAIFGIGFQKNTKIGESVVARKIMRNLFVENMMRGRTASGIAYVNVDEIVVLKEAVMGSAFIELPEYKKLEDTQMVLSSSTESKREDVTFAMGHCRLKTKGTEENNKNNHPIVTGDVVGVHNGVITNDDQLFDKYRTEFDRKADVDSEIIFALINHHSKIDITDISSAIIKTSNELIGSFSCTMVHRSQPHILWFFRNHNPCDILHYKEEGIIIWSSARFFIDESVKGLSLSSPEIIDFPQRSGLAIDFHRNLISRFDINTQNNRYIGYV
jgi:glucosamine 6-phosphate synthetase-like amidotransferase/phosphosugar isomerase protein